MALIRFDGFGLSSSFPAGGWTQGSGTVQTASPRFAGRRYAQVASSANSYYSFAAAAEIYLGFAGYWAGTNGRLDIMGDSGATAHLTLHLSSSGTLQLRRGGTAATLLGETVATYNDAWHFIEIRATINDSTGVCQVRIDGSTSPAIDYSGDTKNGGTNTTIDRVRWASAGANSTVRWTDLYLLNTSGDAPLNTWLGDRRVDALAPSGAGNSTGWTPSAGNNWDCVEEVPESTAESVSATDSGTTDLYALGDMDATVTSVLAVKAQIYGQKSDAGASSVIPVLRTGGSNYDGDAVALSTSWGKADQTWTVNPGTSEAWTRSQVDALEAGVKVA